MLHNRSMWMRWMLVAGCAVTAWGLAGCGKSEGPSVPMVSAEAPKNAKVLSKPVHLRELVSEVNKMLAA